jgi:hypothetical protein
MLGAAEQAAALVYVLRAGGVLDNELQAMLHAAAAGLREAITSDTASTHAARIGALDRRLGSGAAG